MIKRRSDKVLLRTQEIIYQLAHFTFEDLEIILNRGKHSRTSVYDIYNEEIERHTNRGKIGTAESVLTSMRSLKKFKSKLEFYQITSDFLHSYQSWMLAKGKSKTTVGIYLRSLRVVYNIAIRRGLIPAERYPFVKGKFTIPSSPKVNKSLNQEQLLLLSEYVPENSNEQWAKDIWFMSFFCNGANIIDIAHFKTSNIDDNMIRFLRIKTENRSSDEGLISAPVNPMIKNILSRYTNTFSHYLFPIIEAGLSKTQMRNRVKDATKVVNKHIGIIAKKVGIDLGDKNVTMYMARHSYATNLKRNGASYEQIQEALGHKNLSTTMRYMGSFSDKDKQNMNATAFSFLQKPR